MAFVPAWKPHRIWTGLLFTHKNGDFSAISVTLMFSLPPSPWLIKLPNTSFVHTNTLACIVQPGQNSVKVRESENAWALFAGSGIGSLGTGSAVVRKSKKRDKIGKISVSETSRGVAWGRGKGGSAGWVTLPSHLLGHLSRKNWNIEMIKCNKTAV